MFSGKLTSGSIENFSAQIGRLKAEIMTADAILIGAGAGLSAAAGYTYAGARFLAHFSDFEEKYGFHDMYSGGFYPYKTPGEYWAYWSRYISVNRYSPAPNPLYGELLSLVLGKDYFVLTTNVDHCFQKHGFDKRRLFYTQGDYGLFQCSAACRQETFDNESAVRALLAAEKDLRVPAELIPRCPHCGEPMAMNLRSDDKFVQDAGWYAANERFEQFIDRHRTGHVLYLELGVGWNTPGIIKLPFWRMTAQNSEAVYICVNSADACCPEEIHTQSLCISGDIRTVLNMVGDLHQSPRPEARASAFPARPVLRTVSTSTL